MSVLPIRPSASTTAVAHQPLGSVLSARGVIAGSYGAATIALWFLLVDFLIRTPMWAPSLVGAVALTGASPSAPFAIDLGLVAGFSLVHFALFAGFGVAASFALHRVGVRPGSPIGIASLAVALQAAFITFDSLAAPGLGETLGWVVVGSANVAAAISMGLCFGALPDVPQQVQQSRRP